VFSDFYRMGDVGNDLADFRQLINTNMKNNRLDKFKTDNVQMLQSAFKEMYKGLKNASHTDKILLDLRGKGKGNLSPQTLRDCIGQIRKNDLLAPGFICSDVNHGYWLSYDSKEIKTYFDKQLDRMGSQFENVARLHRRLGSGKSTPPKSQSTLF